MKTFGTISAATLLTIVVNAEVFTLAVALALAVYLGIRGLCAVVEAHEKRAE